MNHASRYEQACANALRHVVALNNMSVTLLERSYPEEARSTVRDALELVRKLSDFQSRVDDKDVGFSNELSSWLTEIETYTGERMRKAGERLSQSSKTKGIAVGGRELWDVEPIFLDHRAPDPALQRFLSMEEVELDRRVHPIKIDVFADNADGTALPEDIVSAIILHNYSLALMIDGDNIVQSQRGSGAHRNATRLLLMSMELTYQRLDATEDTSEQLGLHTLAILSVRAMIALHRDGSESRDLYRRTHRGLLDRARTLASLEAVLFGPKQETAAAA